MDDKRNPNQNEGEGSKTADKKYRDAASDFAKRTDTVQAGLEAEREVEISTTEPARSLATAMPATTSGARPRRLARSRSRWWRIRSRRGGTPPGSK